MSSRYPIDRYIVAILVGRTPRYFLWALLGAAIDLPLWGIAIVFVPFLAVPAFAAVRSWRSRIRARRVDVDEKEIAADAPGRGIPAS